MLSANAMYAFLICLLVDDRNSFEGLSILLTFLLSTLKYLILLAGLNWPPIVCSTCSVALGLFLNRYIILIRRLNACGLVTDLLPAIRLIRSMGTPSAPVALTSVSVILCIRAELLETLLMLREMTARVELMTVSAGCACLTSFSMAVRLAADVSSRPRLTVPICDVCSCIRVRDLLLEMHSIELPGRFVVTPLVALSSSADPLTLGLFVTSMIELGMTLLLSIWLNLLKFADSCDVADALTRATGAVVSMTDVVVRACEAWFGVVACDDDVVGWVLRNLLMAFYRLYRG